MALYICGLKTVEHLRINIKTIRLFRKPDIVTCRYLSIGAIIICCLNIACRSGKNVNGQPNLKDSISVQQFIQYHNVCEKLDYLEQHKIAIVEDIGYSRMVALNVVRECERPIAIPLATFRIILTKEQQINDLQEQIDEIRLSCGCLKK